MNHKQRLEELRTELRNETISLSELVELTSLIPYIEDGDVELLEAAGVPEFGEYETSYGSGIYVDKETYDKLESGEITLDEI